MGADADTMGALRAWERVATGMAERELATLEASVDDAVWERMSRVVTLTLPGLMITSTSSALGTRARKLALKAA